MKLHKKLAFGAAGIVSLFAVEANAQSNDNRLAANFKKANQTEAVINKPLTAPVVKPVTTALGGVEASDNANISIVVHHNPKDSISAERYAKGFANAFASSEKTGGYPIYMTAAHREQDSTGKPELDAPTWVEVNIDGGSWSYKNRDSFSPKEAWMLIPVIMKDYVKEHGMSKIIPEDVTPQLIASRN